MSRPRKLQRHLPPCVYFKHGTHWLVKGGKWTKLGVTEHEMLHAYADRMSRPAGGMEDLIDRVLKAHGKKVAANTRAQYAQCAKILKRKLAEFTPCEITTLDVSTVMDAKDMQAHPIMANRVLSFLRLVFRYALTWGEAKSNPCVGMTRNPEPPRERLLSEDEWWAIHAQADARLQIIMELQFLTGQRIQDVLQIRRSQLAEAGIEFAQQKTGARLVVAWTNALKALVARADALWPTKAVTLLQGRTGAAPQYSLIGKQFREAARAAGVEDARPNDTRAMSATAADAQGRDAQKLLGHASAAMTKRYLRDRTPPVVEGPAMKRPKPRRVG